jgi:hypothetical protein
VSGNWSNTATWGGAAVPVNGDAVIINNGITVTLDVNQSSFTNGLLSLIINGTLNVSPSVVTCLKMNGNITGTGTFNMGTVANPIQRAASGSSNRFNLILNATSTIGGINWTAQGWNPTLESTTLSANAAVNATTIVLNQDLGLQSGDQIFIGCGTVIGVLAFASVPETPNVYTVSAYNSSTKTVTLSSGLKNARLAGDYVVFASRPILINRTSGTNVIDDGSLNNNITFNGVLIASELLYPDDYTENHVFNHCTFNLGGNGDKSGVISCIINSTFNYCSFYDVIAYQSALLSINNCFLASSDNLVDVSNSIINNCIGQNLDDVQFGYGSSPTNIIMNSTFNSSGEIYWGGGIFINVQCPNGQSQAIYGGDPTTFGIMNKFKATNCNFTNIQDQYHFKGVYGTLYNCLISAIGTITLVDCVDRPVWAIVESFDHNQIIGNYAAWMKGGSIVTQTISSTPQPGKLTFNPISATIPVFRDFKILAPANRVIRELITVNKTFSGGIVALQIIDPMNDPLIDSSQSPLAQSLLPDTPNTTLQLGIAYKSSVAKELILRILVQNGSGSANIDVTRIQQSFQKPRQLI